MCVAINHVHSIRDAAAGPFSSAWSLSAFGLFFFFFFSPRGNAKPFQNFNVKSSSTLSSSCVYKIAAVGQTKMILLAMERVVCLPTLAAEVEYVRRRTLRRQMQSVPKVKGRKKIQFCSEPRWASRLSRCYAMSGNAGQKEGL